jgi:hypothetical protein
MAAALPICRVKSLQLSAARSPARPASSSAQGGAVSAEVVKHSPPATRVHRTVRTGGPGTSFLPTHSRLHCLHPTQPGRQGLGPAPHACSSNSSSNHTHNRQTDAVHLSSQADNAETTAVTVVAAACKPTSRCCYPLGMLNARQAVLSQQLRQLTNVASSPN